MKGELMRQTFRTIISFAIFLLVGSAFTPAFAYAFTHPTILEQPAQVSTKHLTPKISAAVTDIVPQWWTKGPNGETNMPCDQYNYQHARGIKPVKLTSWRGIEVCGPAPTTDNPVQFIPNPNKTTENEFECTELVKRYLLLLYDLPSVAAYGYQVVDNYTLAYPNLLKKITPDMHIFPVVGDVLSYGAASPGHTSIVIKVANQIASTGSADVTVIEQNIAGLANGTETMHMSSWQMSGMGGTVAEWMTFRTWTIASSPKLNSNAALDSVAVVSPTDVWAVGGNVIEHLVGTRWHIVANPGPGGLISVTAISSNDVWAVGYYGAGNALQTLTEQWNGSKWSVVSSPGFSGDDLLFSVTGVSPTDVWAVGKSCFPSGDCQTLTEHYGTDDKWTIITSPNAALTGYNELLSVTALASNNVWAVGDDNTGSNPSQTLIMNWNGSQWNIQQSPNAGSTTTNNVLYSVSGTASDVWAVGKSWDNTQTTGDQALIEHLGQNGWSIVTSPSPGVTDNLTTVVERSPNDVWAVGAYQKSSTGIGLTLVLHFDGMQWNIIPSPNGKLFTSGGYELTSVALVPTLSWEAWAVGEVVNNSSGPSIITPLIEHFA